MAVYLLHFDRPYKHARHYIGYAKNVKQMHIRIDEHYNATLNDGKHHRLMQIIRANNIGFILARFWPKGTKAFEKSLSSRGATRSCPICKNK